MPTRPVLRWSSGHNVNPPLLTPSLEGSPGPLQLISLSPYHTPPSRTQSPVQLFASYSVARCTGILLILAALRW